VSASRFLQDLPLVQKGKFIMIKTYTINKGDKPTEEQIKEIEEAKKYPIVFDDDCPELSPAMIKAFKCIVAQCNRRKA